MVGRKKRSIQGRNENSLTKDERNKGKSSLPLSYSGQFEKTSSFYLDKGLGQLLTAFRKSVAIDLSVFSGIGRGDTSSERVTKNCRFCTIAPFCFIK